MIVLKVITDGRMRDAGDSIVRKAWRASVHWPCAGLRVDFDYSFSSC